MPAQPEDVLDAAVLEILHQLIRDLVFHCLVLQSRGALLKPPREAVVQSSAPVPVPAAVGGTARRAGPL